MEARTSAEAAAAMVDHRSKPAEEEAVARKAEEEVACRVVEDQSEVEPREPWGRTCSRSDQHGLCLPDMVI